jgi:selenocysteine lyase/cysteine desulfurase
MEEDKMIYLDNAATSWPKASLVKEAMMKAIEEPYGNIGRSAHAPSIMSSNALYECRTLIQHLIPATQIEKIIITGSATQALNTAILGSISEGDTIVTTELEHNAVMRALEYLKKDNIIVIPLKSDLYGRVIIEDLSSTINEFHPQMAIINGASNVNGVVQPLEELLSLFRQHHLTTIIDASQLMGEYDIPHNMSEINGALCFSIHKGLLGPCGVGVMALYGSFSPYPLIFGGTGSRSDSIIQPTFLPDKYESGTLPIPAIMGSVPALEYVITHKEEIYTHKRELCDYFYHALMDIDEIRVLTPPENRVGNITFTMKKETISNMAQFLASKDIAFRSGFHCAPKAHFYLGTADQGGAIRLSIGYRNTIEEIDEVVKHIKRGLYEST